jgi:NADH:ubiquinone oxidoreductase subunit 6 (subunit J)
VWAAALVALVAVLVIGWAATTTNWGDGLQATAIAIGQIAQSLFTVYALPFELVSLLLLAAIIGAIYLARRPEDDERAN